MQSNEPLPAYECDLLIVGTGAAAMTAALTASAGGLRVLAIEKEDMFGGASARSGGGLWIPNSPHAARAGASDSREAALAFIRNEAGERFDGARAEAFVDEGPGMLDFVEANSPVRFQYLAGNPDYHCETPGGTTQGRNLAPQNWDAGPLGKNLDRLRPPLESSTFLGMQIGITEISKYFSAGRKLSSALYVVKCLLIRLRDQFRAGRTMRLASGNALVGGLASAAFDWGMQLWTRSPARRLTFSDGRVTGAQVDTAEGIVRVVARNGVILATGGYPHDSERRARLFPQGASASEVWAALPDGNSGDGIRMGEEVGAGFNGEMRFPVALTPVTRMQPGEGLMQAMPCFHNLGKPGIIAVTRDGKRFCNEARSYHDVGAALLARSEADREAVAWLVFDYRFLRRWGVGPIAPAPVPHGKHIRSGYLKTGRTLRELAENCGINADGLETTVSRFNGSAKIGLDPDFQRGTGAFEQAIGDPEHAPNPCVRPLDVPPYFAIRVFAGVVATFAGLRADRHARALDRSGRPIPGLYVAGNDMASITGGDYIAGGCTLGPGMVFGYIAANHIISVAAKTEGNVAPPAGSDRDVGQGVMHTHGQARTDDE